MRISGQSAVDHTQANDDASPTQSAHSAATAAPARWPGAGHLPGERAEKSGQYVLVDSKGSQIGKEKTIGKGDPFPPARPGLSYKLVDATKHSGASGVGGEVRGNPGEKAERSGQYQLIAKNGVAMDGHTTVTKGEPFPPTPKGGQSWKLVDATGTRRPGEKADKSGQYALVDSNGKTIAGRETTLTKGDKFPATPKSGQAWKLVDATKHAADAKTSGDVKPGGKAPASGQYEVIGADGKRTGKEVTAVKGEPMPPTSKAGQTYKLVDRT